MDASKLLVITLHKLFPPLTWLKTYSLSRFVWDIIAGVTVALTLIPQSLAYASLAELPKNYGLYSAYIGCLVYAFMGSVKDVQVGPVAVVCLLVGEIILETPEEDIAVVLCTLTLLVGLIQFALVILRLGFILDLLSRSVLIGFTNATAITIAAKQINSLLGFKITSSTTFLMNMIYLLPELGQTNPWALLVGGVSVVVLLILKYISPYIPRNALVVAVAAMFVQVFHLNEADSWNLIIVGDLELGLRPPQLPDFSRFSSLISGAGVIALVALIEHIAVAKALARKAHAKADTDQELLSLGVTNTLGAFFSAFPTTGSFSRSSLSEQSGAKTQLSSGVTGLIALLAVLFLMAAFKYIPDAALAAVIITTVVTMIDFVEFYELLHIHLIDFITALITFFGVLLAGAELGILLGAAFSIFANLYVISKPTMRSLTSIPLLDEAKSNMSSSVDAAGNNEHSHTRISANDQDLKHFLLIRLEESLWFPNASYVCEHLVTLLEQDRKLRADQGSPTTQGIVLDCSYINAIDGGGILALCDTQSELVSRKARFVLSGLRTPVKETLFRVAGRLSAFTGDDRIIVLESMSDLHLLKQPPPPASTILIGSVNSK